MHFSNERQELEDFVISNRQHIDHDGVRELVPDLRIDEADGWLKELVRSRNPYDVLTACFAPARLSIFAAELGVDPDRKDLIGRQLISAILGEFNFPQELTPSGMAQIQRDLNSHLDEVDNLPLSAPTNNIGNLLDELQTTIEKVLNVIFLFFSYYLTREEGTKSTWVEKRENGRNIKVEQEEPSNEIKKLYSEYCSTSKTLGKYLFFTRELCNAIEADGELLRFYQRNFRRKTPLNLNQLSELAIFVAYRNIIGHRTDPHLTYQNNEKKVTEALKALNDMSDPVYQEWQDNWNQVVDHYKQESSFPLRGMAKRMSDFVRKFLSELCVAPRTYPKVIVMRSQTRDDYGTYTILAHDDASEKISFTDYDFIPFTEFYYLSRTTLIGIDPLLVSKEDLANWAIPSGDNTENQEEE